MQRKLLTILAAMAVVACGDPAPLVESQDYDGCSPGGIWRAADGSVAIIDQAPRAHIVQPDGVQYVGDLAGVVATGEKRCFLDKPYSVLRVALPLGRTLPNGALEAKGGVSGGWKRRQGNLELWGTLDAKPGPDIQLNFTGAYDSLHAQGSRRATIAGTYRPAADPVSEVVTIDANGAMFSQNTSTGCVLNGSIDPVDERFNVYRLKLDYASCRGAAAVLNGLPAKGLATYDSARKPAELFIALDVAGNTQHYSVVSVLQRL